MPIVPIAGGLIAALAIGTGVWWFFLRATPPVLNAVRPTSVESGQPATLSGESHGIGLQAVAILCALNEVTPRILGTNTPKVEIVGAVEDTGAAGVALSVSLATGGIQTDREIAELRKLLPEHVRLVVGGRGARGARRGPRGVEYAEDLAAFETWLFDLAKRTSGA